jgi:hypothetical protein
VFVFCFIWLPGVYLVYIGATSRNGIYQDGIYASVGLLLCGIQPIIIICMVIMTKSNVKKFTYAKLSSEE